MKVPPKRKGNALGTAVPDNFYFSLNESPSEKEGKFWRRGWRLQGRRSLNESPSEKEGK